MKVILGVSIKVKGYSYIPHQACVIAANHQTPYDGIIFDNTLPRHSYVAKKSIAKILFFGWLFSLTKPIYIDRNKKKVAMKQIIRIGISRMTSKIFVIIFPEGKRSANGKLGKYQKGCAVLSWSSRRPILPIYHNAFNCFTQLGKYKKSGVITVTIGRPIYPRSKTVNEINNILHTWTKHKEFSNRTI
jgi:1-acyl-sn-glycerol-3-phosphate acyltransferase